MAETVHHFFRDSRIWTFCQFFTSSTIYTICTLYSPMYIVSSIINEALRIAAPSFDRSNDIKVRLGRVLWKRKLYELDVSSVRDFLCKFSSTVNLDYVLKRNVSLYAVTKHEAVFVETTESVNIYSSDVNAFMYSAQFDHCRNVIKMPIEYFHVLAEKSGRPSMPVI